MGKYMRKSKLDREAISLMDVSPSSSSSSPLGVLTRAKSLALLQKQLPTSPSPNPPSKQKQKTTDCGGSYLQLRSRRLPKKPPIVVIKRRKQQRRKESRGGGGRNPNPRSELVSESDACGKDKVVVNDETVNKGSTSFEEFQDSERSTRESTPCTLNREAEINTSLGSSTKLNNGISDNSDQREENLSGSHRPTTPDMDRFFSGAEEEQQRQFIEKYNFDPVNEQPLPGRFEWEKIDN
ncbi:cyclin-dependent kinase inhibitor 4 isoform X2 [Raphanus sativus]|uniref:Cyclin-dependent kinase inhibitor 4 isoform X2 n=1 Tax=Raphanus sativus TaxID=3726 RepID=A0A6J0JQF8_RAPSA|nr:cyclin-dependent kinase inhibitor 4 isoform X2 [Raphanus sativus]